MSQFLNYQDIDFRMNGSVFHATQISLSAQASLTPVVLSDGSLLDYAPDGAVVGNMSCDFYLEGSLPEYLNVTGVSEDAITVKFAGVTISNVHLKSLSFSLEPFEPILISAGFDWYGSINSDSFEKQYESLRRQKDAPSYVAHAYRTEIERENIFYADDSDDLGLIRNLSYSASCERPAFFKVDEKVPYRVAKLNKFCEVSLEASNLGKFIDIKGKKASTNIALKDFYGQQDLSTFSVSGNLQNQSYNISEGNYLVSEASIRQIVTEEKTLV